MISNKKESNKALIIFNGTWTFLLIIFALSFSEVITIPMWSQLLILGLIALSGLFFYFGGFFFIQIEVENNKNLLVKHYNLFPIGRKFKAFKIPLHQIYRHEIRSKMAGLFYWLTIYQKMQGGIAKYPPVGLSATNKKNRLKIDQYLSKLEK